MAASNQLNASKPDDPDIAPVSNTVTDELRKQLAASETKSSHVETDRNKQIDENIDADCSQNVLPAVNSTAAIAPDPEVKSEQAESRTILDWNICRFALPTLTAMLADNPQAKQEFRTQIKYRALGQVLLRVVNYAPDWELYSYLFDMLEEISSDDLNSDPNRGTMNLAADNEQEAGCFRRGVDGFEICNPDLIPLMWYLRFCFYCDF